MLCSLLPDGTALFSMPAALLEQSCFMKKENAWSVCFPRRTPGVVCNALCNGGTARWLWLFEGYGALIFQHPGTLFDDVYTAEKSCAARRRHWQCLPVLSWQH